MYNLNVLKDRYPDDYVINMDLLGNGYNNPIYVCFIPFELDQALIKKSKKSINRLVRKYKSQLAKDVYNKIVSEYGE